jgi:phage terminase small subunit
VPNRVKPMDFLEEMFLLEYISCGEMAKAGRAVGLPPSKYHELVRRKAFRDEYERLTGTALGFAEVTAKRIVEEVACLAFLDVGELFNDDGSMKSVPELDEHVRRAFNGVEKTDDGLKLKAPDKLRALELLGKLKGVDLFGKDEAGTNVTVVIDQRKIDLEERVKLIGVDRASIVKAK